MTIANQVKTIPSALAAATGSGTITANAGSVQLEIDGAPSVMVQVSGTWQLDLVAQTSMDGVTWSNPLYLWEVDRFPAFHGHIQLGMNAQGGAQSRNGQFRVATEGATYVRLHAQAAGGTPGSAAVTITPSPVMVAFPLNGYNVLAFDAIPATGPVTSPIFPAPPPDWRWENSETFSGTITSLAGPALQADISDTYNFALHAPEQSVTANGTTNSYVPAENSMNARQTYVSNFIRFLYSATTYNTGGGTFTCWVNFTPRATSPFGFDPFRADQTTSPNNALMPDIGSLTAGIMPWLGSLLLATDATAGANGGKMRRLRVDGNQSLIVTAATPQQATAGIKRKARNVNATVQAISTFANALLAVMIMNGSAATAFVNFYDLATGSVTVGTTVPDLEIAVAAGTTFNGDLSAFGSWFSTAISIASVTTDNGVTGSAAGVHIHGVTSG